MRLVHSQPAEDCVTRPARRRWNTGLIIALLLTLAFDAAAGIFLYKIYITHYAGVPREKLL